MRYALLATRTRNPRESFRTLGACESIPGSKGCQRRQRVDLQGDRPMDLRTRLLALAGSAVIAAASPAPVVADAAPVTHDLMPAPVRLEWQPGQLVPDRRFSLGSGGPADPRIRPALARARPSLEPLGPAPA